MTYRLKCNLDLGRVGDGLGGNLSVFGRIDRSLAMLGGNNDKGILKKALALQFVHNLTKRSIHEVNGFQ